MSLPSSGKWSFKGFSTKPGLKREKGDFFPLFLYPPCGNKYISPKNFIEQFRMKDSGDDSYEHFENLAKQIKARTGKSE